MTLLQTLPLAAVIAFIILTVLIASRADQPTQNAWMVPASLSALFLAWTLWTVAEEGLLGFWDNHTQSMWGNQVWFDLLLAIGIAWSLIAAPAQKLGMHLYRWLALIICTGCIGLLAMLARFLYLRDTEPTNS